MRYIIVFLSLFNAIYCVGQRDSLNIGDRYLEDQLYLKVSYNVLNNQPENVKSSSFSYGISLGYIRDFPIVKSGKLAFGIGLGYGYDSFSQGIDIKETNGSYSLTPAASNNRKMRIHTLELPIEFRIRTSEPNKYSFWRVYAGLKLGYNLSSRFDYYNMNGEQSYGRLDLMNNFQSGLTLSAGYGSFNFYIYYGLTPVFKNAMIDNLKVNTRVLKLGLSFYLL